jgi:hypothetical protein
VAGGPDNAGMCQHCQMARVRQAGWKGVRKEPAFTSLNSEPAQIWRGGPAGRTDRRPDQDGAQTLSWTAHRKQATGIGRRPTVEFGLHPDTRDRDPSGSAACGRAGIHQRLYRHYSLHPFSIPLPPFPMTLAPTPIAYASSVTVCSWSAARSTRVRPRGRALVPHDAELQTGLAFAMTTKQIVGDII